MPCSGTVSGGLRPSQSGGSHRLGFRRPVPGALRASRWRESGQPRVISFWARSRARRTIAHIRLLTPCAGPVSHEDIRASMRIRRTARKAIADYVTGLSGIRARAGDRSEISHLQDRAEMPREKQSPPPPTLIRQQDLETAARPDFINDIVRELTEGE